MLSTDDSEWSRKGPWGSVSAPSYPRTLPQEVSALRTVGVSVLDFGDHLLSFGKSRVVGPTGGDDPLVSLGFNRCGLPWLNRCGPPECHVREDGKPSSYPRSCDSFRANTPGPRGPDGPRLRRGLLCTDGGGCWVVVHRSWSPDRDPSTSLLSSSLVTADSHPVLLVRRRRVVISLSLGTPWLPLDRGVWGGDEWNEWSDWVKDGGQGVWPVSTPFFALVTSVRLSLPGLTLGHSLFSFFSGSREGLTIEP